MKTDNRKLMNELTREWRKYCIPEKDKGGMLNIYGPKGCGKTKLARDYAKSHAWAYYLNFEGLNTADALKRFTEAYLPDAEGIDSWKQAAEAFSGSHAYPVLILFDVKENEAYTACKAEFMPYTLSRTDLKLCFISDAGPRDGTGIRLGYLTIADYIRALRNCSRQDALRLYALTGGVQAVAKDLDEEAGYAENLERLFDPDSAFSTYFPQWLNRCFRCPESYYPILAGMADGNKSLSGIAKASGYTNKKCLTYIEALIKNGFAETRKAENWRQSTYHITTPYVTAWCRYLYGRQMLLASSPERLTAQVKADIDTLAMPLFRAACERFFWQASRRYTPYSSVTSAYRITRDITVKLPGRPDTMIDMYIRKGNERYCGIIPDSPDARYTKEDFERISDAIDTFDYSLDLDIIIFSISRFSDWCVHYASEQTSVHFITAAQLKY